MGKTENLFDEAPLKPGTLPPPAPPPAAPPAATAPPAPTQEAQAAQATIPEIQSSLDASKFDLEYPYVPLSAMTPATYNPREITEDASAALAGSIERFGLLQPIVWNKRTGNIVGGHQKYTILLARGVKEAKTCVVDLDEMDEKLLNVTLNNPAAQGSWNMKALADVVKLLKSKKSAQEFKDTGLEALTKQLPLFDGVNTSPSNTQRTGEKKQSAVEEKLERSDAKMLQLFYTSAQHRQLVEWIGLVNDAIGTDTASDAIYGLFKIFAERTQQRDAAPTPAATA